MIVIPVTVLAVAATGQVQIYKPHSAYAVGVIDGVIVVATRGGLSPGPPIETGLASADAGTSWSSWDGPVPPAPRTSACVPGRPDRCYRIVPTRLKVEESRNGRWVTGMGDPSQRSRPAGESSRA